MSYFVRKFDQRLAGSIAAWLFLASGVALAQLQDPLPLEPSPIMASRFRWADYTMVSGRVYAVATSQAVFTQPRYASLDGKRIESLSLGLTPSAANIEYELTSPAGHLKLSLAESANLTIVRDSEDQQYRLEFRQPLRQNLSLSLEQGDEKETWTGESFWHLYLAAPAVVTRHLVPLLELLRPGWQLAEKGQQIEAALLQRAGRGQKPERARWNRLIEDMASANFGTRQNAERELSKIGPAIVPFLQQLDRRQLDAEQAYRIRMLSESLAVGYEDSADRLVVWLAGDPLIWLALLDRDRLDTRKLAAEQLSALLDEKLPFDPASSEADRRAQVAKLKARLQR